MSLKIKSNENRFVVEICKQNEKYYSVGVSRAYYCVYQRVKHYLITDKYDYADYRKRVCRTNPQDYDYAHKTIQGAFLDYLEKRYHPDEVPESLLIRAVNIEKLLDNRKQADYEETTVTLTEFLDSYRKMNSVLLIFKEAFGE